MTLELSADERNALCDLVEVQREGLKDVWELYSEREWKKAEAAFRAHVQDSRFVDYMRAYANGERNVQMAMRDLYDVLIRLKARQKAGLVIAEMVGISTSQQQVLQRADLALSAAERWLTALGQPPYRVEHVVVAVDRGHAVMPPVASIGLAEDVCDGLNETTSVG